MTDPTSLSCEQCHKRFRSRNGLDYHRSKYGSACELAYCRQSHKHEFVSETFARREDAEVFMGSFKKGWKWRLRNKRGSLPERGYCSGMRGMKLGHGCSARYTLEVCKERKDGVAPDPVFLFQACAAHDPECKHAAGSDRLQEGWED